MILIARAFELAQSGTYRSLRELRKQLVREGYEDVDSHLNGRMTQKQLRQMMNRGPQPECAPV